jgi:hypothetical protein
MEKSDNAFWPEKVAGVNDRPRKAFISSSDPIPGERCLILAIRLSVALFDGTGRDLETTRLSAEQNTAVLLLPFVATPGAIEIPPS